jgi:hypothetical protein
MDKRGTAAQLIRGPDAQVLRPSGFVAGTLVWTREGREPIEELRAGDWVLSKSEDGREPSYNRVVKTFGFEQPRDIVAIDLWKSVEGWMAGERAGLVVTLNQSFYVQGEGWKVAWSIPDGAILTLQDGGFSGVVNRSPLYRTALEGVAWMDGFIDNQRGGTGRTIDLRSGEVRFDYEMVPNPFVVDQSEPMYRFRPTVFNIEVEDNHTYFVGEWGVWVPDMSC